ncbi:MAG: murein L,D-transpeptidase catalytic domain family protein [Sphingobacteriales bacterium]|nr:murein L,D-transpeptidase catalytic domain family protein [Sphingobacteriales bacterium]
MNEINAYLENKNGYNKEIAFLIDMKISSGKNRFFVVDLRNKKILNKGLVAHGYGSSILNSDSLQFSNVPNTMATSIGKYRIGNSYYGKFGKSYKLTGLDHSNSKAFERNIVLHSYKDVPEQEVDGGICYSKGCPMVSFGFFKEIENLIDQSKRSILLYLYY